MRDSSSTPRTRSCPSGWPCGSPSVLPCSLQYRTRHPEVFSLRFCLASLEKISLGSSGIPGIHTLTLLRLLSSASSTTVKPLPSIGSILWADSFMLRARNDTSRASGACQHVRFTPCCSTRATVCHDFFLCKSAWARYRIASWHDRPSGIWALTSGEFF